MKFVPRPIQGKAIRRMVESECQLIALRMGQGKTVATLTAVAELMHDRFQVERVLVVAPLRVAELVWSQEAQKWDHLRHLRVERVLGSARERQAALARPADVHVVNRENFTWLVEQCGKAWPWDCVIVDENRGFKDRGSKAWKALKQVRDRVSRLYLLTGTPTPNGLLELWPQISIMDRGARLGTGITKYRDRWFVPDRRNGQVVYTWKLRAGAKEEIYAAVADIMLSVESDVELPERVDNIVPVRFDMTRYRDLERDLVSGNVMAVNAAVLVGKLAQMANGAVYDDQGNVEAVHDAKLDALEEIVDQGEPVLVLVTYRHDIARIKARFPRARVFDGEPALRAWQAGEVPVLVMHPASGGHGVDGLQMGGRVVVWFGLPFSLDLYEQANARLHRSGQTKGVVVHHLVAQGTVDERIMAVLSAKGSVQQALLDEVRRLREEATSGLA